MAITRTIIVTRQQEELFLFIGEVNRLSRENANFILHFASGGADKLYINSCKGQQKNAYASVADKNTASRTATIINYAISQMINVHVSLENSNELVFEISGDSYDDSKMENFIKSLEDN